MGLRYLQKPAFLVSGSRVHAPRVGLYGSSKEIKTNEFLRIFFILEHIANKFLKFMPIAFANKVAVNTPLYLSKESNAFLSFFQ